MISIDFLINELKKVVSKKRFNHSIEVMNTAKELSSIYGCDIYKASIAAILHDYSKEFSPATLIEICKKYFFDEVKDYLNNVELMHGFASAAIAKEKFGILDSDILNAIKYHTTGRKNMSLLEKIIYIADAIEITRDYPEVNNIRKLVYTDLDSGILFEANHKIIYLIKNNYTLHVNTVNMRNELNNNMYRK